MSLFSDKLFESSTVQKTYKLGTYIYFRGDNIEGVYRVLNGRVKLYNNNIKSNRGIIFNIIYPMEVFGFLEFFSEKISRRCAAIAMDKEVIVQFIPFYELEKLLIKDRSIIITITESLIRCGESYWERFCELNRNDVNTKIMIALQRMANEKGVTSNKGVTLNGITQQELADYVGISRQSVTTAMNYWRKKGKVEYNRSCILLKT